MSKKEVEPIEPEMVELLVIEKVVKSRKEVEYLAPNKIRFKHLDTGKTITIEQVPDEKAGTKLRATGQGDGVQVEECYYPLDMVDLIGE